jgi:carbonic anhydrase
MLRKPFIAVFAAGTVLASAGAQAAWQIVDINARVQTEVDLASANRKDGVVTGWVQHTYARKATTQTGAYFVYRTMKEQVRLDCSQNTLTVLLRGYFDDDGSEIASIKGTAEPRAVMPDTPEQRVLARLCNPTNDIAKALRARATVPATKIATAGETDARFMDGPATQARAGIIRTTAEAQTAAPAAAAITKPAEKTEAKPAEKSAEAIKIDIRPSLKAEAEKTAAAMAAAQAAMAPKEAKSKEAPARDALAAAPRPPVRDVSNPYEARAMKARAGAPLPPEPLARPRLAMLSDSGSPAVRAAAPVRGRDAAPQAGHVHGVRWGYEGDSAPYRWGDLHPEYAMCKQGLRQSPIDIRNPVIGEVEPIRFHYEDVALKVTNNGHTIQVDYAPGSFILFGGSRYELVQFHFHSPSEERINGRVFDMVAHLVHRSPQGRIAMVAVLLTVGAEQPMLQQVWNAMPGTRDRTRERLDVTINASQLLPADRTYYSYMGSLTTPPCTEGVQWLVMKTPVEISREQLAHFTALYPMNARPLQAHNDRLIKIGK